VASWFIGSFFVEFMLRLTLLVTVAKPFLLVLILLLASRTTSRRGPTPGERGRGRMPDGRREVSGEDSGLFVREILHAN